MSLDFITQYNGMEYLCENAQEVRWKVESLIQA